jgi:beta-galactosidase GanA
MRLNRFSSAVSLAACLLSVTLHAQPANNATLPRLIEKDGRWALMVDDAPYLMLGAQINNSSAWPAMLPKVWPTMEFLHVNTVEAPIYWEQFEPERGHFDPSIVHLLIDQAREHHVHLVLLWFGTWKNASDHYTPPFIKLDEAHVPHVLNADGHKVDSLAPFSKVALDADSKAFATLMRELKTYDPQHTVLMVQVENESGTYGSDRDHSPEADKLFAGQVPASVLKAMGKTASGNWTQVFGDDAAEYFHAYSIAHYINQVAAAGKAEDPLPMYVNVALRDPFHPGHAGGYASGGPTDNVIPIWKAAAPAIDAIGPDIYMPESTKYEKELDLYHRPDNAMFVPETGNSTVYAHYFFTALGHQAIGFSPFGMDTTGYVNAPMGAARIDNEAIAPFALNYSIFSPMDRVIAKLSFEGKLQAVSEDPAVHEQTLSFGNWKAVVSYGRPQFGGWGKPAPGNDPTDGGAMIAQLGPDEFLVTGVHARIDFTPTGTGKQRQFVAVQEGTYDNGEWKSIRVWNGDQTDYGLNFTSANQVLRVTLATY